MRLNLGLKILSIFAALLLVTACETAPTESGDSSGGGATTQTSGTSGSSSSTGGTVMTEKTPSVQPGSQEDLVVNVGDRVFFGFDKYDLSDEAQATLQRQAAWLKANPSVTLLIQGNCDERGTREYNLALGDRRATAVKNYLVTLGVSEGRVSTISYGKERPVALGHTEAAWAQNRNATSVVN